MSSENGNGIPGEEPVSMHGKTVVITGASSGLGLATAEALAMLGARIVMVCRDRMRADAARRRIEHVAPTAVPVVALGDLEEQAQVRAVATTLRSDLERIDVLINNAGGIFAKRELSVDGIEKTFAVNQLAPFLLTNLVTDLFPVHAGARVVVVTSEIYSKKLDLDNLQSEQRYNFFRAYQSSKLANILFTVELARRLASTGVTVNAVSPGPAKTRFGDNLTGLPALMPKVMKKIPRFRPPEEAALGIIRLASSPDLAGVTGKFFLKLAEEKLKPVAEDPENAKRLWEICEELTGLVEMTGVPPKAAESIPA
jgi:NAD(P)-dependent dehydrogenase (short-subunit alcohol dehydrogenase family)